MNTYSSGMASGILFGVLFVAILCAVKLIRGKNVMEEYDERQLLARFKAYQISFYILLCGIIIDACLKMFRFDFYEDPLGELTAVMTAVVVFAVISIRQDAFTGLHTKRKPLLLLYGVICLSQFLGTVGYIMHGELIENGRLTVRCISPVTLAVFLIVFVMMLMQRNETGEE